jgi:hypothetical protein
MTEDEKTKIERETPIRDGDARPDQQVGDRKHPGSQMVERTKSEKQKTTKERGADVDSSDDFRDAR